MSETNDNKKPRIQWRNEHDNKVKKLNELSIKFATEKEKTKGLNIRITEKENQYQQLLGNIDNNNKPINTSIFQKSNFVYWVTAVMTCTLAVIAYNQHQVLIAQNEYIVIQNDKLEQQSHLAEAERTSQLNILTNSVLNDLNEIVQLAPEQSNPIKLHNSTSGRIIALSHYLKPYYFLEAGELIKFPISPERGLLLVSLMNYNICNSSLDYIYKLSNFTQSDLSNINLSNKYLHSISLHGANLSGANLENSDLSKSDLRRANLRGTQLTKKEREKMFKINNGIINKTNLQCCDLSGAKLRYADCRGSNFEEANLTDSNIQNADFRSAFLKGAIFEGANLTSAKGITYEQLITVKSLKGTKGIPESILSRIIKDKPELLEN